MEQQLTEVPPEKLSKMLERAKAIKQQRVEENRLQHYAPYPKQKLFHNARASHRERLLIAANQSGKSLAGGMEISMHATGIYPDWWEGKRFDGPTNGWVAASTNEVARDTVQRILVADRANMERERSQKARS